MRTFDDPPTTSITWDRFTFGDFFAARLDMRGVTPRFDQFTHIGIVVSLVRAKMLLLARRWFGSSGKAEVCRATDRRRRADREKRQNEARSLALLTSRPSL